LSANVRARERQDRTSGVLGSALASGLLFSSVALGDLGLLVAIVSPLPLVLQRLRNGLGSALMAALLATSLVGFVLSPGLAIAFAVSLVWPVLLIGQALALGRGLVRGCGWAFVLLSSQILLLLLFAAPQMSLMMLEPLNQESATKAMDFLRSSGWSPEAVEAVAEQSKLLYSAMQIVYPAVFIIMGAVIVLANAMLLRVYLGYRDPGWLEGGEFETIRWPFALAVLFVISGLSVIVPPLRPAAYNVLLIVAFFFALQGLAVVFYYARRLAGPPVLRIGLVVLVLLNPWAPHILGLLGLFDTWFDFRKWAEPPEEDE
jgi:uncharacterized protein YybS (DUF2232 family)